MWVHWKAFLVHPKLANLSFRHWYHAQVAIEVIAALVHEDGLDVDLAVLCAMLHEVIEETNVYREDLENEFGSSVANGVLALSKNDDLGSKQKKWTKALSGSKNSLRNLDGETGRSYRQSAAANEEVGCWIDRSVSGRGESDPEWTGEGLPLFGWAVDSEN